MQVIDIMMNMFQEMSYDEKEYFRKYDFCQRLLFLASLDVNHENIGKILSFFNILIENHLITPNEKVLFFCLDLYPVLLNKQVETHVYIEFIHCLTLLIDQQNVELLKIDFFISLQNLFLSLISNEQFKNKVLILTEKISRFISLDRDHVYFYSFFQSLFDFVQPTNQYYLFLTLKNIVSKSSSTFGDKRSWAYLKLLNSYVCDIKTQVVTFEIICLVMEKASSLLMDENIKGNLLAMMSNPNDERLVPGINALMLFLKNDPENFLKAYMPDMNQNFEIMSSNLIKLILESSYSVKVDASYLLAFLIEQNSTIYIKYLINSEYSGVFSIIMSRLKDAIAAILDFDETLLLVQILKGILSLIKCCEIGEISINDLHENLEEFGIVSKIEKIHQQGRNDEIIALSHRILHSFSPKL